MRNLIDPDGRFIDFVEPVVQDKGYALVRVVLTKDQYGEQIVQIMVEPDTKPELNLDGCAEISRSLSVLFEVENPVPGAYRLEVSSAGIDRPLTREKDFELYQNFDAKIELKNSIDTGQRRFRGVIKGFDKGVITIDTDEDTYDLPLQEVKKASLIVTDELMEFMRSKSYKNKDNQNKEAV